MSIAILIWRGFVTRGKSDTLQPASYYQRCLFFIHLETSCVKGPWEDNKKQVCNSVGILLVEIKKCFQRGTGSGGLLVGKDFSCLLVQDSPSRVESQYSCCLP